MKRKPPSLGPTPKDMKWLSAQPWTKKPKDLTAADVAAAQRLLRGVRAQPDSQVLRDVTRFMNHVRANRPGLAPKVGRRGKVKRQCAKCGGTFRITPQSATTPFHRPLTGGEWCKTSGAPLKDPVSTEVAQPEMRRVEQADPAESTGRNRSTCPVCRAQIAFDDDDRMNYHRFPGYDATCVTSDRPRGWFPSTVEEGLPKRLRTGETIPRRDLRRMESAVAKVVAIRHESERAEKRRARIASMSEEERRRSRVRYREVSGGAPGLGKRR